MGRFEICLLKNNDINYTADEILKFGGSKEITFDELKKIKQIKIFDNETGRFINHFYEGQHLIEYDYKVAYLKEELNLLKTELGKNKNELKYSNQQLEYYKSLNEM